MRHEFTANGAEGGVKASRGLNTQVFFETEDGIVRCRKRRRFNEAHAGRRKQRRVQSAEHDRLLAGSGLRRRLRRLRIERTAGHRRHARGNLKGRALRLGSVMMRCTLRTAIVVRCDRASVVVHFHSVHRDGTRLRVLALQPHRADFRLRRGRGSHECKYQRVLEPPLHAEESLA